MKFSVQLLLLLFVTFLSTPTIVSLVEKNCDTSIFFTMTEEEENHKELKVVFSDVCHHSALPMADRSTGKIRFENLSRHDNVFRINIFTTARAALNTSFLISLIAGQLDYCI